MSKTPSIMNKESPEVYNSESFWYPTYRSPQTSPQLTKITIQMKTLFCFLDWTAVITTKKSMLCYVDRPNPQLYLTYSAQQRETQTHTCVLKKQVLKALMMLPAALFPTAPPLSGDAGGSLEA